MKTLNLLCPESMFYAANHLAAAKGQHIDDLLTFRRVTHTRDGMGYCHASVQVSDSWIGGMSASVTRPAFDTDALIDLDAAQSALNGIAVVTQPADSAALPGAPAGLVLAVGTDLAAHYGMTPVDADL